MWSREIKEKKKWSEDKTMNFVRAYRSNDCLWDVNHKDYKNRKAREVVCCVLADKFKCTPDDVRRKIKSLRGAYTHERNKINESLESGFDVDDVYVPNVIWYDEMDAIMNGGSSTEVENTSVVECTDYEPPNTDVKSEHLDKKDNLSSNNDDTTDDDNDDRLSEMSQDESQDESKTNEQTLKTSEKVNSYNSSVRKINVKSLNIKRTKEKNLSRNLFSAINKLHSISSMSDLHSVQENEFDVFGRSVAQQLKNFIDIKTALRVQHKIQSILYEERIHELSSVQSVSVSSGSDNVTQQNNSAVSKTNEEEISWIKL